MRVLVTGGAGYVGYEVVGALLAESEGPVDSVVVYDNLARAQHSLFMARRFDRSRVSFVNGDILDHRTLDREVATADVVVHLAARVTTPNADRDAHHFDQVNNWGSSQVASAVERASKPTAVVYLSSAAVYGDRPEPVTVESRPRPASMYGISKLKGEAHIDRLADLRRVVVIRAGNVYGPNPAMRFAAVINRFAFEARFRGRVTIEGSGAQTRPFVHVAKLASAVREAVVNDSLVGTYNFAEHNIRVLEVAEGLRDLVGDLEMLFVDQDVRMREVTYALDSPLWDAVRPVKSTFEQDLKELVDYLGV